MRRALLDLNVLIDVLLEREPHYQDSAYVLSRIVSGELQGFVPIHALTTIYYIVKKHAGAEAADEAVDWLLGKLEIATQDATTFLRARALGFDDFEDAVVAAVAEQARCDRLITRNIDDFGRSPVTAVTPEEFVADS